MGKGKSRKEFTDLFLSGLKEVIPELMRQSGNNSASFKWPATRKIYRVEYPRQPAMPA